MTDHAERLEALRDLLGRYQGSPRPGEGDQLQAATRETRDFFDRFAALLPRLDPERKWERTEGERSSVDAFARMLAAIGTGHCRPCSHLKRGGPQPAIVRLAVHRIDCQRCISTWRRPPDDESDRCDWCGKRQVTTFTPMHIAHGPLMVLGDACEECATALQPECKETQP